MKALLIVAHGSRKRESNEEIFHLAQELGKKAHGDFNVVKAAFIQFTTPLVPDVIGELAEKGVTEMTVLPYFIAGGSHVTSDIPELIADARKAYPKITFTLTTHLGKFEGMVAFILSQIAEKYPLLANNENGGNSF